MFHVDSFKAVTFHVIGGFSFHLAPVHMRDKDKYLSRILLAQADYFGGFRSPCCSKYCMESIIITSGLRCFDRYSSSSVMVASSE